MPRDWEDISRHEMAEEYPVAIAELERFLGENPNDKEAVIRLGFDYWLGIVDADRLNVRGSQASSTARRFMALLRQKEKELGQVADFCWAYGLPLSLHYYYFAINGFDASEVEALRAKGERLLYNAAETRRFLCQTEERLGHAGGASRPLSRPRKSRRVLRGCLTTRWS